MLVIGCFFLLEEIQDETFLWHIHLSYKVGKSVSDCITDVGNRLLLLKGLHMCIYIDYIEKKNLSNDQCCFRVDIWGVYTACLSCNNYSLFFVLILFFFSWMNICLWGLCMEAAICSTWENNCVYRLWSFLDKSMIELSFRLYPYQIVDFFAFQIVFFFKFSFVVYLQKVCVN